MICTPPSSVGPSVHSTPTHSCTSTAVATAAIFPFPGPAPALHQREMYLRALEQEREEILAAAYAAKRSRSNSPSSNNTPSSSPSPSFTYPEEHNDVYHDDSDADESDDGVRFDERGRQLNFRETVRQRQARLEFLRRQEFARRLAHRGLEDAKASAYAIKRLPPPRARPIERVNAAITIQRAYRLHRAVAGLNQIAQRVRAAHDVFISSSASSSSSSLESDSRETYDAAWRTHADTLHALLRELGERTGVLCAETSPASTNMGNRTTAATQNQTLHPRVRAAARAAMEALRGELAQLDRFQVSRYSAQPLLLASSSVPNEEEDWTDDSSSSSSDSNSDDDDDEYEDDYSSYTYTPSLTTSLYVVDEEDEDVQEEKEEDAMFFESAKGQWVEEQRKSGHAYGHQRSRHAPILVAVPTPTTPGVPGVRSPVARSPSLASIPEEVDVEC